MHLSIVLSIIVAFFACTALTLYRFRGRKPIMVFVLAIQMTSGGIIPQIIIYNQLGLLNKYSGLIWRTSPWCCRSRSGTCAGSS